MDASSSATEKKTKLSVRNQTRFKKPLSSVNIPVAKKKTNLCMREQTLLNKAYELSTLCDIQVCVIYYGPDGELIKTWPEDQSKVRDMAERFIKLSDGERRKKSTNLSQFLTKKINEEKKRSLDNNDNKFSHKVLEMERSLETRLKILQDKLRLLSNHDQTEPDKSLAVASKTEQNNNFAMISSGIFSTDLSSSNPLMTLPTYDQSRAASSGFTTHLSPSLIDDPHQKGSESLTNHHLMRGVSSKDLSHAVYNSGSFAIDSSNHHQNKFSIFLYNHDNATFTQLSDSASSFDQALTPYNNLSTALLGAQGFGGDCIGLRSCSNNNIPTQNPLVQYSAWN